MADMQPIVEMRDLSVGYSDVAIVREFSTVIARRSVTCLIGGNGAGKSTLLKAIFGMNRVLGGRLLFDGRDIVPLAPSERLRAGIGFVPQGRCNFPLMTVKENLEMGAFTLPRREISPAIDRVVALFPVLRRKWRERAGNLSGGEQQMLETAMILETGPQLLLLDEPSLGLSPKVQSEVFDIVRAICDSGVTVAMVEQNAHEALLISDRAIVMDLGRKFLEGPARDVMHDPQVKAAFLGGGPEVGAPPRRRRHLASSA